MEAEEFNVDRQPAHRERRFRRLFRNVPTTEILLCRFSCAYVSDLGLLLQGHLYVSHNWICFHSNIFGIEKIIEIPVESVVTVSKAHTAKIIPNAVKIKTQGKYYLFGSLISRDNTYRLLFNIAARCHHHHGGLDAYPVHVVAQVQVAKVEERTRNIDMPDEDVSSLSSLSSSTTTTSGTSCVGGSGRVPASLLVGPAAAAANGLKETRTTTTKTVFQTSLYDVVNRNVAGGAASVFQHTCRGATMQRFMPKVSVHGFVTWFYSLPKILMVLILCVALLAFLFLCATFLTMRLMYIQNPTLFRTDFLPWSSTTTARDKQRHVLPRQTLESMDAVLDSTLKTVNEAMSHLARIKLQLRNIMVDDPPSPVSDVPFEGAATM